MNQRITNLGSEIRNFGPSKNLTTGAVTPVAFAAADLPVAGPKYVLLQVQGQITRITYDGTAPTTAVGQRKQAGDETLLPIATVLGMKFLTESGAGNIWAQPCDMV